MLYGWDAAPTGRAGPKTGLTAYTPYSCRGTLPCPLTPQTLNSHGEILANFPGILGFYPQDSLVLALGNDVGAVRPSRVSRFFADWRSRRAPREPSRSWTPRRPTRRKVLERPGLRCALDRLPRTPGSFCLHCDGAAACDRPSLTGVGSPGVPMWLPERRMRG